MFVIIGYAPGPSGLVDRTCIVLFYNLAKPEFSNSLATKLLHKALWTSNNIFGNESFNRQKKQDCC